MNSWFDQGERRIQLRGICDSWKGTRWFPNSAVRGVGGGVSCQQLMGEIYREAGCCNVDIPVVPMVYGRFNRVSLAEPFIDGLHMFARIPAAEARIGDLLSFETEATTHHLGIMMDGREFFHAYPRLGANYSSLDDAVWGAALRIAWRPRG